MLLGLAMTALLLQQAAAGPRVDAALASAKNVKPGDLRVPSPAPSPAPDSRTVSGLPPEEHERLITAMKDWQDNAAEMSKEMFLHKYGSRLTEDPHTVWNKLDVNGDSKINGKEISQGAVNLESALKRPTGTAPAGTAKPASGAGMDFNMFSKMLAMDKHTPRDVGHLFTEMDKDEDGRISQSEFASYKHLLSGEL